MPFGLFEYLVTPFGLSNAAQTFQQMMDRTINGLQGTFSYIEPTWMILVSGLQIGKRTSSIWRHFCSFGLAINLEICVLQSQLWNILVTRFRQQVWPPRPSMLLQSKLVPPLRISSSCNIFSAWTVAPGPAPCGDLPVSLTCGVCTHIYICSM
jgi:hypothetical protein